MDGPRLPLRAPPAQNVNTHPDTVDQTDDVNTDVCGGGGAMGSGLNGTGGKSTPSPIPPVTNIGAFTLMPVEPVLPPPHLHH